MTNYEYEKASVEAASATVTPVNPLAHIDKQIALAARALDTLMEARRELVNRLDLNKGSYVKGGRGPEVKTECLHDWDYNPKDMCGECSQCGEQRR